MEVFGRTFRDPTLSAVCQLLIGKVQEGELPTVATDVAIRSIHIRALEGANGTVNFTATAKTGAGRSAGTDLPELVSVP